jgi:hypothetical protein
MIKFKGASKDGRALLGVGLSEKNIEMLKLGRHIYFFGEEAGFPGMDIFIMYGQTEDDIAKELAIFER